MSGRIIHTEGGWAYQPGRGDYPQAAFLHARPAIPRSIREAVQQRITHLSAGAKHLLMLAAVAGRRFDFTLLQQLTQYDEQQLLVHIKELVAAQLVVEESEEQFAFRHALTRQAIYADLLVRECKLFHRAIAEALERLYPAALDRHLIDVAYHFHEAGVWDKALEYAQRAGEKAQALYTPRAAVAQFTRALDAAAHLALRPPAHLYRARGQAYETLGEFDRAQSDYEQALHSAHDSGDGTMEWQSLMDLGLLWSERDYQHAGAFFQRASELAQQLADPKLQAHSLNRLGNWLVNVGQAAEGLQAHQQALAIFEGQQDTHGMAQTFDLLGVAHAIYGDAVNAVQHYARASALFRALEDYKGLSSSLAIRSTLTSRGVNEPTVISAWSPEACERDAVEAVQLAHQVDWPAGEALAEHCLGLVLAAFGKFGAALAHMHRALQIATEINHQQWMVAAYNGLGRISVLMLAPTKALRHLEAGLPLAQQLGSAWWIGHTTTSQALAYLLKGEFTRAEAVLAAVMPRGQLPRNLAERRMAWAWGELALAQGQPDIALDITEQLLRSAPGGTSTIGSSAIPWLLKLRGQALLASKRLEEAVETLEQARQSALEGQERPLLWQIHRVLGQAYYLLRYEEQARQEYAAACEVIASLARTIDEAHLREQFIHRALASLPKKTSTSPRQVAKQAYGGLTAREREVALKVAQGKSNREIAAELVVSERTVETHVSNILCKLGFTSRTQVAAWAVEVGLAKH